MNEKFATDPGLLALRELLDIRERERLSPLACLNREGVRRSPQPVADHRQAFATDTDRILHSRGH